MLQLSILIIKAAQAAGDPDLGDTYYHHWLEALENLLAGKGLGSPAETPRWRDAWRRAAGRTPHRRPIEVQPDDFGLGACVANFDGRAAR